MTKDRELVNSSEFLSINFYLVSYPKCHQTSKDDNILQVNELPKEDELKSLKKLIEQDIQDWIKRFPELNSMFSMENEYNDNERNKVMYVVLFCNKNILTIYRGLDNIMN